MTYLLKAFGHSTLVATDGAEGVDIALRAEPDLILCDLALPRLSGLEVARLLKADAALRSVPLIAVTASAMAGDRDRVIASGFDGYITKPITPETFVSEVEAYLRHD
jgi:two-component system cell cycle response regulator